MKMIKPHVELLTQQYDKLGIFEMVELAGRTSYKSEKNMSFDENGRSTTAEAFLINSYRTTMVPHQSMLRSI